jgi:prolyl oligopeptidase
MKSLAILAAAVTALSAPAHAQTDPHQWLEAVEAPASLAWVAKENARATTALQGDPRYQRLHDEAFAILSADDRIPALDLIGPALFTFWQNREHVRGVWLRSTPARYRNGAPQWETVLDIDALARTEKANWVFKAADCVGPDYRRCLIYLSDGGKDAVEVREFDLASKRFVEGGFRLPEGKQTVEWLDPDSLILSRAADGATESGYGYIVRTLKRGQPLEAAVEVFRGGPADVSVSPRVLKDGQGRKVVLIERGVDFFNTEFHVVETAGTTPLRLPPRATVHGYVDARLIVSLQQDWTYRDWAPGPSQQLKAGSLIGIGVWPLMPQPPQRDNFHPVAVLFEPGPRQSLEQVEVTANRVVAVIADNVRGSIVSFGGRLAHGARIDLPAAANAAVTIVTAGDVDDKVFYTVEGFIDPTQMRLGDAGTGDASTIETLPSRFDTAGLVVEQFEATSKDGVRVPYFLVRHEDAALDGTAPTLLHGYGGFQISKAPIYEATVGKLWLEKGGAYAVANIRGGGEFGPAWHEAALNENRQRAFDDFFAVAEDLIARRVTSPRRLGIYGRSNGGLLMGVAMTQRPELFNAVVVESPLLDMLRYHELPAGASWIGEYGDPRIAEEAAWIARYSPYQALKPGVAYPLAYITTNMKDDRVHPGHARKFAARLAELGQPYLYYEDTEGGHANAADPRANAVRWGMHYTYLMQRLMD